MLAVGVRAPHVIVAITDLNGRVLTERRLAQDVADGPEPVLDRAVKDGLSLLALAGRSASDGWGWHRFCRDLWNTPPAGPSNLRIALPVAGDSAAILGASQMVTGHVLPPAAIEATLQAANQLN